MTSTTTDLAVDRSTHSTSSNDLTDDENLKQAPGSCRTAQASSYPSSSNNVDDKARSFIATSDLLRHACERDQTHSTPSKPTSSYRSRSLLRSAVRSPSPERVNHQLSHSVPTHTREPFHAGTRPGDKASIDEGKAVRRRRSAFPRAVRQLQRECDILVLVLEK